MKHKYSCMWIFALVAVTANLCRAQQMPHMVVTPDKPSGVYQVGDTVRWTVEWKGDTPAPAARYTLKSGWLHTLRQGKPAPVGPSN